MQNGRGVAKFSWGVLEYCRRVRRLHAAFLVDSLSQATFASIVTSCCQCERREQCVSVAAPVGNSGHMYQLCSKRAKPALLADSVFNSLRVSNTPDGSEQMQDHFTRINLGWLHVFMSWVSIRSCLEATQAE